MASKVLFGKKILLFVTGSVAAYKAAILTRLFIKSGIEVKIVMTRAAADFITPLTFATLSKQKVLMDIFEEDTWANHVMLGRWADLILVAPASCNTIAKMATGICDNLMLAIYLSATCPVFIAPAMDDEMWNHPVTQRNILTLQGLGHKILPVNRGELASGLIGDGRMAEPETIITLVEQYFRNRFSLKNIKALVTAGPTHEPIDPVRFIANHSTGTMGVSIAEDLAERGAQVDLIAGPVSIDLPYGIKIISVTTAREMLSATMKEIKKYDIIVMSAAVADFRALEPSKRKIKKEESGLVLRLGKTTDILAEIGKVKKNDQTLIGFALETNNEKENALKKLKNKNADLIILNSLNDEGAGFGDATNKITIFDRRGNSATFDKKPKREVARDIVNKIIEYRNA
jgi:phosphopantothenoylcysteine decarboxylase / phosphopantothenate---cysteine ligase